ncbi:MAG: hydroxymethylbilane synthase [Acidimicrobiales bacterium]
MPTLTERPPIPIPSDPVTLLRAATRGSPLALWQTEHVTGLLRAVDPSVTVEVVVVDTQGDRRLDIPIWELGGKGVFAKEVQAAVLDGRADIAVHSAKDLPSVTIPGLVIAATPERGDPRDALVGSTLTDLPEGAEVATGSLRRQAQLAASRPDLRFVGLRGNMATRLAKAADHDAIVVAAAALDRLGLADAIAERLSTDLVLPQVAQAALAVECREDDVELRALLAAVEHEATRRCVDAERAFLAELGGDCSLPAAAYAAISSDGTLSIEGRLAAVDGSTVLRHVGPDGAAVARHLLSNGGNELLNR